MPISATTRVLGPSPAATQLIEAVARRSGIRLSLSDAAPADVELRVDPTVAATEGYTLSVGDGAVVGGADQAGRV